MPVPQPQKATWKDVAYVLNRFSKLQLKAVPTQLDSLFDITDPLFEDECQPDEKETKYDMISGYVRHMKRHTDTSIAYPHIQLLYVKISSSRRVWKIYKTERLKVEKDRVSQTPEEIESEIQEEILKTHNSETAVQLHNGAYWIHISAKPKRQRRNAAVNVVHLVHYSHTSCFASSTMSAKFSSVVCKAMEVVFMLENSTVTALQDKNLDSLFQLFLDSKYPERCRQRGLENLLVVSQEEQIQDYDPRIVDLEKEQKEDRNRAFKRKFGWEKAPPITKLTYELHTNFGGKDLIPRMKGSGTETFTTTVVFTGADVLNGVHNMVRAGLSTGPLPSHLVNVRTHGRTKFLIRTRES